MKEILVIDIETTGFINQGGKIVEVGITALDLDTGNKRLVFDKICHERPITREEVENCWIIKNSTLTLKDIQQSNQLNQYKEEIQLILNDYPLGCTAYNNKFDFGFMESRGFIFPVKLPCPMILSVDIVKAPWKSKPMSSSKYKYPSVQEAWNHFFGDTGYIELHRGGDDSMHEADIIYELYKLGVFKIG